MTDKIPFDDRLLCVRQFGNDFHPLFLVQCERLVFDAEKRKMLPLQLGKHGEINHPVLVLRERAFGVTVLTDNFFRIGNNLFNGKLFETFVPFLQCLDGDGGGFLLVYLHITEFGFCLPYLYIGLYLAFFLLSVEFLHLLGVFLVPAFKGLHGLFILLRLGKLFLLRCFGCFGKFPCRYVVIEFFDFMPFLVQFLECHIVTASVIGTGNDQLRIGFQKFLRLFCHMGGILGFQTFAVRAMAASVMLGKEVVIGCVVYT